jgi:uncharacterized membrane protein YdjX (TVP38/TMEM64 family)
MPGVPGALKNYAAASMGAKFTLYLAVSWPLSFMGAAALIVLGDSLATQRPEEALLALLIVLPIALIAYHIRRRWRDQTSSDDKSDTRSRIGSSYRQAFKFG